MARRPGSDFPDFDAQTVASQGNAILGIRDSGKSYTAIAIAERFFEAGIPFCAFDPIGRWRFLRVPGQGRGYPVVVAGGAAGDLPLTVESAPKIVRAAMEGGVSLVLDLYDMEVSKADWKRIVGDSIRVLLYENGSHGLRHIFIEEAAEFAPQRVAPDQGRVYAEVEKLARMGGNARLGYTLINQRAEEVNKAVLELCDNLFLHRQKGRNSLNALTKWLNLADVKPGSKEIIQSLPMLPQGECWAWMGGTDRPVHMKVPEKNSFEPDRRAMRGDVAAITKKAVDVALFVADLKSRLTGKTVVAAPPAVTKPQTKQPMEKDVKESEARALRSSNEELFRQNEEMRRELAQLKSANQPAAHSATPHTAGDVEAIISEVTARLTRDPTMIRLTQTVPEIEVMRNRQVVKMDESTQPGLIAALIADGFFEDGVSVATLGAELKRRGRSVHPANVSRDLGRLAEQGFLTKEENGYRAVASMKINIVER